MHIEEAERENSSLNLDIHGSKEHSTPSQPFSFKNEKGFSGMHQTKTTIQFTPLSAIHSPIMNPHLPI